MTKMEQLHTLISEGKVLSATEVASKEIPPIYLSRLEKQGVLERIAPGMFIPSSTGLTERAQMEQLAQIAPSAVFCLHSALRFHHLTETNPHALHVAIPAHARLPKCELPVTVYYLNASLYVLGLEEHPFPGGTLRVYSLAKTVVDCFRFRRRVGMDLAIEALREALESHRVTPGALWEMASACRAASLIRPYLEAMA